MVVNASNVDSDFAWMAAQPHPDATVTNVSDEWALIALQGPRAPAILAKLSPDDLAAIKYYRFAEGTVAGKPAILSRTGYTGEDGFELYLSPGDAPAIWDTLLDAGRGDGLLPAGLGARDTLRLEAGMALYGHEIDATTSPWEAGLDWVVKMDKGDFIGRGALEREQRDGPRRKLVGFDVTGRGIARQGHAILHRRRSGGRGHQRHLQPDLREAPSAWPTCRPGWPRSARRSTSTCAARRSRRASRRCLSTSEPSESQVSSRRQPRGAATLRPASRGRLRRRTEVV